MYKRQPLTGGASLALTALSAAGLTASLVGGVATVINNMAKKTMTDEYVKKLKAQHKIAAECVSNMYKLRATLEESQYEAGRFFTTDSWEAIMTRMKGLPDMKWERDIEEIVKLYTAAVAEHSKTNDNTAALIQANKDKFPKGRIDN